MDKARNAAREEILYGDDEARLELAEQGRLYAPDLDYRPLGEAESAAADILVRPECAWTIHELEAAGR